VLGIVADKNIIKEDKHKVAEKGSKEIIHEVLKSW
jgi:hypothetical protein